MNDISILDLTRVLNQIGESLPGGKTKHPRASFFKAAEFLRESGATTIDQLVSNREPQQRRRNPAPLRQDIVSLIRRELSAIQTEEELERKLSEYASNKMVRVGEELKCAADLFLGAPAGRSREEINRALRNYFSAVWKNDQLLEHMHRTHIA